MFESFLPFIVAGVLGFLVQPPIAEVGINAGPYWPEVSDRDHLVRMTAGATAYSPLGDRFGVEFGASYKQGGYSWSCFPCFENRDRGHDLHDYLDVQVLGRARIPVHDRLDLRVMLGPTWGAPVACRTKNLTNGTEQECDWNLDSDVRLVAGAGVAFRMSRRFDLTASYRYGLDLREWNFFQVEVDGGSDFIASSLIAGITYRLAG